jgi:hypothetical protein
MMNRPCTLTLAAMSVALVVLPALGASRVIPAQPAAFEPVTLRMTVDSCAFIPGSVRVRGAFNTLRVTQLLNECLVAGAAQVVDVRLGSLPPGDYRVEVYATADLGDAPVETLGFNVQDGIETTLSPAPPYPLTDYSGLWWNPNESGWGMSLQQSPLYDVFGAWFVYGPNGQPEWFTLQGGQWLDSTTWRGTLYRTTGPSFAGAGYDPRLVQVQAAGTATLDFLQRLGEEGTARFTYTVNGNTVTKTIERMRF